MSWKQITVCLFALLALGVVFAIPPYSYPDDGGLIGGGGTFYALFGWSPESRGRTWFKPSTFENVERVACDGWTLCGEIGFVLLTALAGLVAMRPEGTRAQRVCFLTGFAIEAFILIRALPEFGTILALPVTWYLLGFLSFILCVTVSALGEGTYRWDGLRQSVPHSETSQTPLVAPWTEAPPRT